MPGSSLALVAIDRLPFPRPDEPLLQARRERARADAFRLVDLPRAATLLAQGAGRLIRTQTDQGVVAVLDPRLATNARYRWDIVRALPPMRRTRDRAEAEAFLADIAAGAALMDDDEPDAGSRHRADRRGASASIPTPSPTPPRSSAVAGASDRGRCWPWPWWWSWWPAVVVVVSGRKSPDRNRQRPRPSWPPGRPGTGPPCRPWSPRPAGDHHERAAPARQPADSVRRGHRRRGRRSPGGRRRPAPDQGHLHARLGDHEPRHRPPRPSPPTTPWPGSGPGPTTRRSPWSPATTVPPWPGAGR